jgi:hypothetical protein
LNVPCHVYDISAESRSEYEIANKFDRTDPETGHMDDPYIELS